MNAKRKIGRHLLYWICIAVTLLGISLIFVSFHIQTFSPEIRSIGTTLCSVGIIGFIFQYYFQTATEKRIEEIINGIKATINDLKAIVKPNIAKQAEEIGIKRILFDRDEFDEIRLDLYNRAKKVSWLSVGPDLPPQYSMEKEIGKCLERETNFRFLAWAGDENFQRTVERLTNIKKNNKGRGEIEIMGYEEEPKWYIQIIDDIMYAHPYLHGVPNVNIPMFEVEKGKVFYIRLLRHFEEIWRDEAKPIDQFSSENKR